MKILIIILLAVTTTFSQAMHKRDIKFIADSIVLIDTIIYNRGHTSVMKYYFDSIAWETKLLKDSIRLSRMIKEKQRMFREDSAALREMMLLKNKYREEKKKKNKK